MKFRVLFASALHSLKGNARRTILTMLGIIIGIAAVITIMSLGKGFQKMAISGLAGEDNGRVSVQFYFSSNSPDRELTTDAFTQQDKIGIQAIDGVDMVDTPEREEMRFTYGVTVPTRTSTESITLGLERDPSAINVIAGEGFTQVDFDANKKVAIVDQRLAEELYPSMDAAIGHGISLNGELYYIKGIKSTQDGDVLTQLFSGAGPSTEANVPASTYSHYVDITSKTQALKVFIKPGFIANDVAKKVQKYLDDNGGLRNMGTYQYVDVASQMDAIGKVLDGLTYFISAVAGISLFIAGVGVMNMMYISVSERTKEIGIRRAMGATKGSIQLQFLLEGIVITSIGGIVGYLLGVGLAMVIAGFLPFQMYTDLSAILLAIGVSVFIGIVFSVFPAKSAANKDVIEILR